MRTENIYSVYAHKNLKNDKYYVGMTSQEPKKRWNNGWGYQNNSKMWNDIQESDWNNDWIHGILGKFENKQDALKYEAFLIAMLGTIENGYNTSEYGSAHSMSEDTKNKISYALTGENNPNFGKHRSEGTRKKISEALTGEKHPNFGKYLSEETKNKMSEALKGNTNAPTKSVIQYSKYGEFIAEYSSAHEAERKTGCHNENICRCCKGKYKTCGGYIWKYKEGV